MSSFERLVLGHSSARSKMARRKWTVDLSRFLNRDTVGLGERQYSCGSDCVDDEGGNRPFAESKKLMLCWFGTLIGLY